MYRYDKLHNSGIFCVTGKLGLLVIIEIYYKTGSFAPSTERIMMFIVTASVSAVLPLKHSSTRLLERLLSPNVSVCGTVAFSVGKLLLVTYNQSGCDIA